MDRLTILAQRIHEEAAEHKKQHPSGDWRAVNERLSQLRKEAVEIIPDGLRLGNAELAERLDQMVASKKMY